MMNEVRIIAGKWRGRKISFPSALELRPTPDRVRETLFNWLMRDIVGATCLDLFAGSGALSFEALSRGAKFVLAFEKNPLVLKSIKENQKKLEATNLILSENNEDLLASPKRFINRICSKSAEDYDNFAFDIIFLDPPFQANLWAYYLDMIAEKNLLNPKGFIYVEAPIDISDLCFTSGKFKIVKSSKAGKIYFYLFSSVP